MIPCEKFFVQLFILISANFKIKQRGRIKVKRRRGEGVGKEPKERSGRKTGQKIKWFLLFFSQSLSRSLSPLLLLFLSFYHLFSTCSPPNLDFFSFNFRKRKDEKFRQSRNFSVNRILNVGGGKKKEKLIGQIK